jgi:hypothetical protein
MNNNEWDQDRWKDRKYLLKQMWDNKFSGEPLQKIILEDMLKHAHEVVDD